jgi:hypothetical protein
MDDIPQILSKALEDRAVEVVVACIEGCGTSIISDPSLLTKVGGKISGSDSASPDVETISAVGSDNILDPETAKVDNIEGVCVAYDNGIHKVAATTGSLTDAQVMRDMFGSDLIIVGIFDGLSDGDRDRAIELSDIVVDSGSIIHVNKTAKDVFGI